MTRINVVDPSLLMDQHLLAEIRELPRLITYIENHYHTKIEIPSEYVLGTGHMKFFVDKTEYLLNRQRLLIAEYTDRGFSIKFDLDEFSQRVNALPAGLRNGYTPTYKALSRNVKRLLERINAKPKWYRYTGSVVVGENLVESMYKHFV